MSSGSRRSRGGFWPGSRWIDAWAEALSGLLSPYEFNPLNINPLRDGYVGGLDHFGLVVDDIDTVIERARAKFPRASIVKRPLELRDCFLSGWA